MVCATITILRGGAQVRSVCDFLGRALVADMPSPIRFSQIRQFIAPVGSRDRPHMFLSETAAAAALAGRILVARGGV
jgi:hypothetical protein